MYASRNHFSDLEDLQSTNCSFYFAGTHEIPAFYILPCNWEKSGKWKYPKCTFRIVMGAGVSLSSRQLHYRNPRILPRRCYYGVLFLAFWATSSLLSGSWRALFSTLQATENFGTPEPSFQIILHSLRRKRTSSTVQLEYAGRTMHSHCYQM
jgi:hypothetical protein